jgi:NAD(P)-dependent dehydrogenase (short-subunit alcohol dehydrogenase family)/acyl dehydratase/putative sterol carrier protein
MPLNLDAVGKKLGPFTREYGWKDVVLYALGVGAGFDDLEYAYEEKLKVIPSFSVGAVFDFLSQAALGSNADLSGILHGEQEIIFHAPIPTEGTLTTEGAITKVYDLGEGKGALVIAEADTYHSEGQKLYTNVFTLFCRRDGGFGGEPVPKEEFAFPDRDPDFEEAESPSADQPLIYRLSGDVFALHVDPNFAKAIGFEKPIMHGLCTHGYACRAVIKHLFPGQPERMTLFKNRFSKTLYPGVGIKTQIWKLDDGRAVFRVVNVENDEIVIDRGEVQWDSEEAAKKRADRKGIRFDDRVAIVTGSGAGLGRVYALELAKRGAKVVVNDLGGSRDGTGASQSAADKVVEEIKALGGEAVANYDSVATVEGGQAIVDAAIEAFGRLDILIGNAGILRDKTMAKMEPELWNGVMSVHLDAAYNVARPAFMKMREGGYGRIVMTTSAAGLYGNFGQTNYSAAKLGLVGFANTLKIEGGRHDIKTNVIAPVAATRMTEDILPPDLQEKLQPEAIAPIVLFMCSEKCPVNGEIYNAGAGYFNRVAVVDGPGTGVGDGTAAPSPEEVVAALKPIMKIEGATEQASAMEAAGAMLAALTAEPEPKADSGGGGVTPEQVFEKMPEAFVASNAEGVEVVFQFTLSGDGGGDWSAAIKDGTCTVESGVHGSPTTTINMSAPDFVELIQGRLNAMKAYTSGQLKIGGDLMKSQLIEKLFKF